jgi:hypothetical protein
LTPGITKRGEAGKLRLFDILQPSSGEAKIETLDLTIIVDNSVIEVWANDRFVMSTWVWYVLPFTLTIDCRGICSTDLTSTGPGTALRLSSVSSLKGPRRSRLAMSLCMRGCLMLGLSVESHFFGLHDEIRV